MVAGEAASCCCSRPSPVCMVWKKTGELPAFLACGRGEGEFHARVSRKQQSAAWSTMHASATHPLDECSVLHASLLRVLHASSRASLPLRLPWLRLQGCLVLRLQGSLVPAPMPLRMWVGGQGTRSAVVEAHGGNDRWRAARPRPGPWTAPRACNQVACMCTRTSGAAGPKHRALIRAAPTCSGWGTGLRSGECTVMAP